METDTLVANVYEPAREIVELHLEMVDNLLYDFGHRIECRLTCTFRTAKEQVEIYSKGRILLGGKWVKKGKTFTNALPEQTPHCVHKEDGTPAAMAWDIILLEHGRILQDTDPAWAVIPFAAQAVAPGELKAGAFWGDWPHTELINWRELTTAGVLHGKPK